MMNGDYPVQVIERDIPASDCAAEVVAIGSEVARSAFACITSRSPSSYDLIRRYRGKIRSCGPFFLLFYSLIISLSFAYSILFELSVLSANTLLLLRFRAIFKHAYDASLDQCSLMSLTVAGFVEPWAVDAEELRHST